MKINKKIKYLSRIRFSFIMLLFTMCLTMNVFFCCNYNLYELLDRTTGIETRAISENVVSNGDGNTAISVKGSFINNNNSYTETITKNMYPILMIADIPKGFSLLSFLVIVFFYFFFTLFILLPDRWTLMNQKVRLDI